MTVLTKTPLKRPDIAHDIIKKITWDIVYDTLERPVQKFAKMNIYNNESFDLSPINNQLLILRQT